MKFTDYTADKVRSMCPSAAALRSKWSDAEERAQIIAALEDRGISFEELAAAAKQPDADPFDLLCHVAFNAPLRTRQVRAEMLRKEKRTSSTSTLPKLARELSGAVRKSETVALRHPVVPIADGFVCGFVRVYGFKLRERGTAILRPCQRISTSMSCS